MRGEQRAAVALTEIMQGSPPLARGTVPAPPVCGPGSRITPACAGNRYAFDCSGLIIQDHPRLRGEQMPTAQRERQTEGSPPLARGTAIKQGGKAPKGGITPACAGNSLHRVISSVRTGGSPPLARGTAKYQGITKEDFRITPACAGNRPLPMLVKRSLRDHPRLRGEQPPHGDGTDIKQGSPPLARGTGLHKTLPC